MESVTVTVFEALERRWIFPSCFTAADNERRKPVPTTTTATTKCRERISTCLMRELLASSCSADSLSGIHRQTSMPRS